jgi:histidinol phosphatase-like enzyme
MKIFVDIDHTICTPGTPEIPGKLADYSNATPIQDNIDKVNHLYDQGHEITMWTARGTVTKIDWTKVTRKQLNHWGVKFHHLKMGKPAFDLFIDDKVLNVNHWTEENVKSILKL